MDNLKIPFICTVLISCFGVPHGKYVDEHLITHTDWEFLSRFCWLSLQGTLDFYFEIPEEYAGQKILLYYDTPGQWFSVYKTDKTCEEKIGVLNVENNQIISLSADTRNCTLVARGDKRVYECTGGRYFRSMRERWWYIAVSRCGKDGIDLRYKLWMKNGDGNILFEEFSADEFYILPIDIGFLLFYDVLIVISIICAVKLMARHLFHVTYKLYLVSLVFWTFYLLLMSIKYGIYSEDGVEKRGLKVLGHIVAAIADVVFIIMLLLMASGYTITRGRLSHIETVLLIGFVTLYFILYACIFIWEQVYFDPGLVLYLYESPPGYCLITLRIIGWIWFFILVVLTLKKYPLKGTFYCPFVIFYTLWFWLVPVMVLIAKFALPPYKREKIIIGIENSVVMFGHLFFLFLTIPQRANVNFPFHVRTTQIRTDSGSSNNLNYFDEHAYQASSEPELTRNDVVFDMFVVTCRRVSSTQTPAIAVQIPPPSANVPAREILMPPSYDEVTSMFQANHDTKNLEGMNRPTAVNNNTEQRTEKTPIDRNMATNNMAETSLLPTLPSVLNMLQPLEHHREPGMTSNTINIPPEQASDEAPPPVKRKKKKKKRPSAPTTEPTNVDCALEENVVA